MELQGNQIGMVPSQHMFQDQLKHPGDPTYDNYYENQKPAGYELPANQKPVGYELSVNQKPAGYELPAQQTPYGSELPAQQGYPGYEHSTQQYNTYELPVNPRTSGAGYAS